MRHAFSTSRPRLDVAFFESIAATGMPTFFAAISADASVPESTGARCSETTASNPSPAKRSYTATKSPGEGCDVMGISDAADMRS